MYSLWACYLYRVVCYMLPEVVKEACAISSSLSGVLQLLLICSKLPSTQVMKANAAWHGTDFLLLTVTRYNSLEPFLSS